MEAELGQHLNAVFHIPTWFVIQTAVHLKCSPQLCKKNTFFYQIMQSTNQEDMLLDNIFCGRIGVFAREQAPHEGV